MELCSIEDAFPDFQSHKQNSKKSSNILSGSALSKEERRAMRKKAKKAKEVEPAEQAEVDPDRPSLKRMGELPAFVNYSEAFQDLSGAAVIPKVDAILKNVKLKIINKNKTHLLSQLQIKNLIGIKQNILDQILFFK